MYGAAHQYVEEDFGGYGGEGEAQPMTSGSSDLDRGLYNDLVQIVPLVQSLIVILSFSLSLLSLSRFSLLFFSPPFFFSGSFSPPFSANGKHYYLKMGKFSGFCLNFCGKPDSDGKSSSSYSRRGSVIYTKTPSKKNDARNKNGVKSKHGKKQPEGEQDKHDLPDDFSASSVNMPVAKDSEELNALREELEDLRRQLVEKDELLRSAEVSKNQRSSVQSQVDELKRYAAEKDSAMKTTQQQLHDAKIKLADKRAALEKLQWEAKTSNQKVEKLQEELNSMQSQISSFMLLFEGLSKDNPIRPAEDYDVKPPSLDSLSGIDDMEEIEMQKMEEARQAYLDALAIAKEKQDEDSLAAASRARLHLQSFVFKSDW